MTPRHVFITIAAAWCLTSIQAEACTVFWTPYDRAKEKDLLVVKAAQAQIEFDSVDYTDPDRLVQPGYYYHAVGRLILSDIRCIQRPASVKQCPSSLTIEFDHKYDGAVCPDYATHMPMVGEIWAKYYGLEMYNGNWKIVRLAKHFSEL